MHLIENYALTAGVKISNPTIETLFYPLPFKKYITIQCSSGMVSKNFDYYNDVVRLIKPYLIDNDIEIVQIGLENDPKMSNVYSLLGKTNIRQVAYVIENAILHLGNDSFACHFAGHFNVPLVALYGPAVKETCKPYWGDPSKQILLSPDNENDRPSYSAEERVKRVNSISTFKICRSVLDLLDIPNNFDQYEQVYIGESYYINAIDIIPNFKPNNPQNPELANLALANLRLDYVDKLDYLDEWLLSRPCNVYINSEKYLDKIIEHKNNIKEIHITLNMDVSNQFVEKIHTLNKPVLFYAENNELLPHIRIKFFEVDVLALDSKEENYLDICDDICDNYFQSSLKLYSNYKIYPCKAYLNIDQPISSKQKVINCSDFYKEMVFFKIYKLCQHQNQNQKKSQVQQHSKEMSMDY